jgi:hypothetical protein
VSFMRCTYPRNICHGLLGFLVLLADHYQDAYQALRDTLRNHFPPCTRNSDPRCLVMPLFPDQCACRNFHPCSNRERLLLKRNRYFGRKDDDYCRKITRKILLLLADLVQTTCGTTSIYRAEEQQLPTAPVIKIVLLLWFNRGGFYPYILRSMET